MDGKAHCLALEADSRRGGLLNVTSNLPSARIQSQIKAVQGIRRQIHDEVFSLELSRLRLHSSCCPHDWTPFIVKDGVLHCYFKVPFPQLDTAIPILGHLCHKMIYSRVKQAQSTPRMRTSGGQQCHTRISIYTSTMLCRALIIDSARWSPKLTLHLQVVAASGGKLVSVFDGETEYHLGRWIRSKRGAIGWPPLDSCFYACPSPEAAIAVAFPKNSRLSKAPRVLLQVHFC